MSSIETSLCTSFITSKGNSKRTFGHFLNVLVDMAGHILEACKRSKIKYIPLVENHKTKKKETKRVYKQVESKYLGQNYIIKNKGKAAVVVDET